MIKASLYSLLTVLNLALLPFYWDLYDKFRYFNKQLKLALDLSGYDTVDFDFNHLEKYLLVLIIFTITLGVLWILFCVSQRKVLDIIYLGVLLLISIMGLVMVNELKHTYDFLFKDREECIDAFIDEDYEHSLTRYSFCQESWVYTLYYVYYGVLMIIVAINGGILLIRKNDRSVQERQPENEIEA